VEFSELEEILMDFFSSSRPDDLSELKVGEVSQNLDDEKGGNADLRKTLMSSSRPRIAPRAILRIKNLLLFNKCP
jgi:hypothetical protein